MCGELNLYGIFRPRCLLIDPAVISFRIFSKYIWYYVKNMYPYPKQTDTMPYFLKTAGVE
jgi:hypothetical protein